MKKPRASSSLGGRSGFLFCVCFVCFCLFWSKKQVVVKMPQAQAFLTQLGNETYESAKDAPHVYDMTDSQSTLLLQKQKKMQDVQSELLRKKREFEQRMRKELLRKKKWMLLSPGHSKYLKIIQ